MHKIILTVFSIALLADKADAQISFAPEIGLNMATMSMKVNDLSSGSFTYATGPKAGLAIGGVADMGITENIYFQPGFFYVMNGVKLTAGYETAGGVWNINTLAIPLNFEYKTGETGGNRFFIGTGPYIGYNISASYKYDDNTTYGYYASSGNLKIGNSAGKYNIKPLDLGWGINTGYLLANGFYLRLRYQMGFTNLNPYSDKYDIYKSSAYGITIGYLICGHNSQDKKVSNQKK